MIENFDVFDFDIKTHNFDSSSLISIASENFLVTDFWPSIYILINDRIKEVYIGESANIITRFKNHLNHKVKKNLNSVYLITSKSFNKSATLDIESNLIKYFDADKKYKLINGNAGLINQNYYQKTLYGKIFLDIWKKLQASSVAIDELKKLDNTDYFKYSPYKSLTFDQLESVTKILELLTTKNNQSIFIKGSAGTGKTIVAVYLMKLLLTDIEIYDEESLDGDSLYLIELVKKYKEKHPNPKIALVVPMTSLRGTLKKVFKSVKGLSTKNVIGPSGVLKSEYDLLLVDESHRLRRRKNITNYKSFDKNNNLLGLDQNGTELDWILRKSSNQIFFYDPLQSIRPSDIPQEIFQKLIDKPHVSTVKLKSQLRVIGGVDYINFIDDLLECNLERKELFLKNNLYEFYLFDDLSQMINELQKREDEFQQARLVAGYAWKWKSKKKSNVYDIHIQDIKLKWNSVNSDWINSKNAFFEVGCIHTTQGYDLNYTGVIFGNEISYNPDTNEIVINKDNYFDRNGKSGIVDVKELKNYILNIYKTLMYRGMRGTFVYACDENLRRYLEEHILSYKFREAFY
ncbi:hypothetical protein GGR22_003197 [Flavobacterium gossypii]|uniref:GIY-YIG domain-containing protein n=1 Tax=Flavobacterium gossypii TaxID=1646119 RepID=A0ABR6DVY5_9FLAO|nr:DUF2075 domain-containing protein [Flavobacterium gossypii]MBA9075020.1 hypothetical protein [Flavobacterium gossypii]